MTTPLYRTEALEAGGMRWLGTPLRAGMPLAWWGTWLLLATMVAMVSLLAWGEYTRRARVAGQLVPDLGTATVVSPVAGVVERVFGEEGARVQAGAPLVLVRAPRVLASGTDVEATLRSRLREREQALALAGQALAERHDIEQQGLYQQLQATRSGVARLDTELGHHREQLRLARAQLDRYEHVAASRFVSQAQLQQQQQSVLELAGREQALLREHALLRREALRASQALRELPAQQAAQRAGHAMEQARLAQERLEREAAGALLLQAPVTGQVAYRGIEPGQAVQPGQPLLGLLPENAVLQAELRVPSHAAGFVAAGDRVLLRYAAYPHAKFGHHSGQVLRIARSAMEGDVIDPARPGQRIGPHYRVRVALDHQEVLAYGRREPLHPGMTLEADILGERRKLYEWLLEPLYALRGRLTHGAATPSPTPAPAPMPPFTPDIVP